MNLKSAINQCIEGLGKETTSFPWEEKSAYAHWLGQTYYYVCHSTRLLALAASRFEDMPTHNRFLEHLREERGHEQMATNDLKALGVSISDIPCYAETHAFYQTQYYYLEHATPEAFFGWIICLEATAARSGMAIFERIKAAHGEKAGTFMKIHSQEDVSHVEKAFKAIEGARSESHPKILENLQNSATLYADMLRRCDQAGSRGLVAA